MKKLIVLLMFAPLFAYGQASHYKDVVTTVAYVTGVPVSSPLPGATVSVCTSPAVGFPCTNLATLYTDATGTTACNGANGCSNPLKSDAFGNIGFWAASGNYQYTVKAVNGKNYGPFDITLGGGSSGAQTNVANTFTQPQIIGAGCPAATWGLSAQAVNGIVNAACFSGSDLGTKITSAIALLPTQGGTVFIPSSLSGTSSASGVTLPANVSLQFDAGTFTLGGALTIVNNNHTIRGVARGATQVVFSGATDGVVIQGGAGLYERYTVIEDLSLTSGNTGGGAGIRIDDIVGSPTKISVNRVVVNTLGNSTVSEWQYGIHAINMQYCSFTDVAAVGAVNVGLHTESTEENLYNNFFVNANQMVGNAYRGVEQLDNATLGYSSNDRFIGGGSYGSFNGSAFYINGGGSVRLYAYKGDNPGGATLSDTYYFVADNAKMVINGASIGSSVGVVNGGQIQVLGGSIGDTTIDATSFQATLIGVSYHSLTNNHSTATTLVGNTTWAGSIDPFGMPGCTATNSLLTCAQVLSTNPFLSPNGYSASAANDLWMWAPTGQSSHLGSNGDNNKWTLDTSGNLKQVRGSQSVYTNAVAFQNGSFGSQTATMAPTTITAHRDYTLPDASGNVVLDTATQTLTNKTFTAPALGAATATSLLATGIIDGLAPITKTTGASATLGGTYNTGYTFNQNATAATAITYTLPTAVAGKQYCVKNSYNGTAANTGTLTLQTSATGQFLISNGALSATGGYIISAGAAGDAACAVAIDATHWEVYAQSGTWTLH